MSNRRRLPKDRKPKCASCKTALVEKPGYGLVCSECARAAAPAGEQR